jgi:hypothetical protein
MCKTGVADAACNAPGGAIGIVEPDSAGDSAIDAPHAGQTRLWSGITARHVPHSSILELYHL